MKFITVGMSLYAIDSIEKIECDERTRINTMALSGWSIDYEIKIKLKDGYETEYVYNNEEERDEEYNRIVDSIFKTENKA